MATRCLLFVFLLWIISSHSAIIPNLKPTSGGNETINEVQSGLQMVSKAVSELNKVFLLQNVNVFIKNAEILLTNRNVWKQMLAITDIQQNNSITVYTNQLGNAFKNLSDNVKVTGHIVHDILSKFKMSKLQKKINQKVKEIDLCKEYFREFLANHTSLRNVLNFVHCFNDIDNKVAFSELLTNNTDVPSKNPLFGEIITQTGYCNGSDLLQVFHYFLGKYVQGCIILSISEEVKYKESHFHIQQKCIATLNKAAEMQINLCEFCRNEPCTHIYKNIHRLSKNSDIVTFSNELQNLYPWFNFLVLRFKPDTDPSVNIIGSTLNSVTIDNNAKSGVQVILWSSQISNDERKDVKQYKYGIEFNSSALYDVFNSINMHLDTMSGTDERSLYVGYVQYPDQFRCRGELTQDNTKQNIPWSLQQISIPRYGIITLGTLLSVSCSFSIGIVAFLVIRRRHITRSLFCGSDT